MYMCDIICDIIYNKKTHIPHIYILCFLPGDTRDFLCASQKREEPRFVLLYKKNKWKMKARIVLYITKMNTAPEIECVNPQKQNAIHTTKHRFGSRKNKSHKNDKKCRRDKCVYNYISKQA